MTARHCLLLLAALWVAALVVSLSCCDEHATDEPWLRLPDASFHWDGSNVCQWGDRWIPCDDVRWGDM